MNRKNISTRKLLTQTIFDMKFFPIYSISESDGKILQHFVVERHVSRLSLKALDTVDHGFDLGIIIEAYELPQHVLKASHL